MSSFVAIHGPSGREPSPQILETLAEAIIALGPDRHAQRRLANVALLHSLLAVTFEDSRDAQPLALDDRLWIAGHIRVDARAEMIAALRQHGRSIGDDATDAALVLNAYDLWGEACLDRLIGDFSFVIWDAARRVLFCARDHFGVRPFYYSQIGDSVVASNSMTALLAHPELDRTLDQTAVGDFLLFGYSREAECGVYRAIRRLPPAHALTISDGRLAVRRYWSPPEPHVAHPKMPVEERVERFSTILSEAVADRIRSDKVAITLSGGMDSTLIAAFAKMRCGNGTRLDTFSGGADWLTPDTERHYASLTAAHLGLPFHPVSIDQTLLDPPGGFWLAQPEPRFSLRRSGYDAIYERIAASGTRLTLSGMGGDVLAAINPRYWADLILASRWSTLATSTMAYRRRFGRRPPIRRSLQLRLSSLPEPVVPRWLNPDFVAEQQLPARLREGRAADAAIDPRLSMVASTFWSELLTAGTSEFTGFPLIGVHPLFDRRLFLEALTLPPAPFLHQKAILRMVGAPLLPPTILARRKQIFAGDAQLAAALRGSEPEAAAIASAPELDRFVDRTMAAHDLARIDRLEPFQYSRSLDRIASLGHWLQGLS